MAVSCLQRRHLLLGTLALGAGSFLPRFARAAEIIVYNGAQLSVALASAAPGDTITLAPGNYGDTGRFVVRAGGTESNPVTIRAQTRLQAVLRSSLSVEAPFVTVDGLTCDGAEVDLRGDGIHVTRCLVQNTGPSSIEIMGGRDVRVSYCEVARYRGRGIMVRLGRRHDPVSPRIDHNHIHDSVGRAAGGEAIQLAQAMKDSNKRLGAVVEYNLMQRCEGDSEAVSVKCSGNTIRFNTLEDSRANLVNRHGEDNVWAGNTLSRAYSIVVHDRGNKLLGNRCVNSLQKRSIRIMGGSIPSDSLKQGGHPQAVDTLVCGNSADVLIVGDYFSQGSALPAVGTTIADHQGPVVIRHAVDTRTGGGEGGPIPAAVHLTPNEVGPDAGRDNAAGGRESFVNRERRQV